MPIKGLKDMGSSTPAASARSDPIKRPNPPRINRMPKITQISVTEKNLRFHFGMDECG
jgi:hypothetical protein